MGGGNPTWAWSIHTRAHLSTDARERGVMKRSKKRRKEKRGRDRKYSKTIGKIWGIKIELTHTVFPTTITAADTAQVYPRTGCLENTHSLLLQLRSAIGGERTRPEEEAQTEARQKGMEERRRQNRSGANRRKKRPRTDEESKWMAQSDRRSGGERGVAGVDVVGMEREVEQRRKRRKEGGREKQRPVSR